MAKGSSKNLVKNSDLTQTEIHKIKNFERGHGILSVNNNNIAVAFKASPMERQLITTDPEELRNIYLHTT